MSTRALEKAIKIASAPLAPSPSALARLIGVRQQNVSNWLLRGRVPVAMAILIEKATGVPKSALRPDVWGEP